MGYSYGFIGGRDIGYGVPALCDYPDCKEEIDRGLSFACGGWPGDNEFGCPGFFCGDHMSWYDDDYGDSHQACDVCCFNQTLKDEDYDKRKPTYKLKDDIKKWVDHKMTHESWAEWREKEGQDDSRVKQNIARAEEIKLEQKSNPFFQAFGGEQ